jgi:hypothetical protein
MTTWLDLIPLAGVVAGFLAAEGLRFALDRWRRR